MLDPIAATGVASSIITFIDFSYKVSERTIELSKSFGELPKELQTCERLVAILGRSAQRLKLRGSGTATVPTAAESDLELLLDGCIETTESLLIILSKLKGAPGSLQFRRAIKSLKAEGRIAAIRSSLDQHILEILVVLEERCAGVMEETREIVAEFRDAYNTLHGQLLSDQQHLADQLDKGFAQVQNLVRCGNSDLTSDFRQVVLDERAVLQAFASGHTRLLQSDMASHASKIESEMHQISATVTMLNKTVNQNLSVSGQSHSQASDSAAFFHVKIELDIRGDIIVSVIRSYVYRLVCAMDVPLSLSLPVPEVRLLTPGTTMPPRLLQNDTLVSSGSPDQAPILTPGCILELLLPIRHEPVRLDITDISNEKQFIHHVRKAYNDRKSTWRKLLSLRKIKKIELVVRYMSSNELVLHRYVVHYHVGFIHETNNSICVDESAFPYAYRLDKEVSLMRLVSPVRPMRFFTLPGHVGDGRQILERLSSTSRTLPCNPRGTGFQLVEGTQYVKILSLLMGQLVVGLISFLVALKIHRDLAAAFSIASWVVTFLALLFGMYVLADFQGWFDMTLHLSVSWTRIRISLFGWFRRWHDDQHEHEE